MQENEKIKRREPTELKSYSTEQQGMEISLKEKMQIKKLQMHKDWRQKIEHREHREPKKQAKNVTLFDA